MPSSTKPVSIAFDDELLERLDAYASDLHMTRSAVVREAVERFFAAGPPSFDRGFREGIRAAYNECVRRIQDAIATVDLADFVDQDAANDH